MCINYVYINLMLSLEIFGVWIMVFLKMFLHATFERVYRLFVLINHFVSLIYHD